MYLIIGLTVALGAAIRGNWSPCGESLQAQLHPLGERSRGNRWGLTILFFTVGSAAAGAILGALFAAIGAAVVVNPGPIWLVAGLATVGGLLDLSPFKPWTPKRQVNENWIGRYRGWVYGAAFGVQLGLGFTVFVMSWGYYTMLAIALVSSSPMVGATIGAIFGIGRGILLYLSRRITTPNALITFHRAMATNKDLVFRATASAACLIGVIAFIAY